MLPSDTTQAARDAFQELRQEITGSTMAGPESTASTGPVDDVSEIPRRRSSAPRRRPAQQGHQGIPGLTMVGPEVSALASPIDKVQEVPRRKSLAPKRRLAQFGDVKCPLPSSVPIPPILSQPEGMERKTVEVQRPSYRGDETPAFDPRYEEHRSQNFYTEGFVDSSVLTQRPTQAQFYANNPDIATLRNSFDTSIVDDAILQGSQENLGVTVAGPYGTCSGSAQGLVDTDGLEFNYNPSFATNMSDGTTSAQAASFDLSNVDPALLNIGNGGDAAAIPFLPSAQGSTNAFSADWADAPISHFNSFNGQSQIQPVLQFQRNENQSAQLLPADQAAIWQAYQDTTMQLAVDNATLFATDLSYIPSDVSSQAINSVPEQGNLPPVLETLLALGASSDIGTNFVNRDLSQFDTQQMMAHSQQQLDWMSSCSTGPNTNFPQQPQQVLPDVSEGASNSLLEQEMTAEFAIAYPEQQQQLAQQVSQQEYLQQQFSRQESAQQQNQQQAALQQGFIQQDFPQQGLGFPQQQFAPQDLVNQEIMQQDVPEGMDFENENEMGNDSNDQNASHKEDGNSNFINASNFPGDAEIATSFDQAPLVTAGTNIFLAEKINIYRGALNWMTGKFPELEEIKNETALKKDGLDALAYGIYLFELFGEITRGSYRPEDISNYFTDTASVQATDTDNAENQVEKITSNWVKDLKGQIDALTADNDTLREREGEFSEKFEELQTEIISLNKENKKKDGVIAGQQNELKPLEQTLKNRDEQITTLATVSERNKKELEDLQEQVTQLNDENADLVVKVEDSDDHSWRLEASHEKLKKENEALREMVVENDINIGQIIEAYNTVFENDQQDIIELRKILFTMSKTIRPQKKGSIVSIDRKNNLSNELEGLGDDVSDLDEDPCGRRSTASTIGLTELEGLKVNGRSATPVDQEQPIVAMKGFALTDRKILEKELEEAQKALDDANTKIKESEEATKSSQQTSKALDDANMLMKVFDQEKNALQATIGSLYKKIKDMELTLAQQPLTTKSSIELKIEDCQSCSQLQKDLEEATLEIEDLKEENADFAQLDMQASNRRRELEDAETACEIAILETKKLQEVYQAETNRNKKSIEDYTRAHQAAQKTVEELEVKAKISQKIIGDRAKTIKELKEKVQRLEEELERALEMISSKNEELAEQFEVISNNSGATKKAQELLASANTTISRLKQQLETQTQEIEMLEKARDAASARVAELEVMLLESIKNVELADDEVMACKAKFDEFAKSVAQEQENIRTLAEELDMKNQISMETSLLDIQQRIQQRLKQTQDEKDALEQQVGLTKRAKESDNDKIEELKKEIQRYELKLQDSTSLTEEFRNKNILLNRQNKAAKQEAWQKAKEVLEDHEISLETLREEHDSLMTELREAHDLELSTLLSNTAELNLKIKRLTDELDKSYASQAALRQALDAEVLAHETALREHSTDSDLLASAEIALEDLKSAHATTDTAHAVAKTQVKILDENLRVARQTITDYKGVIDSLLRERMSTITYQFNKGVGSLSDISGFWLLAMSIVGAGILWFAYLGITMDPHNTDTKWARQQLNGEWGKHSYQRDLFGVTWTELVYSTIVWFGLDTSYPG